jgi:radical SAM protein with 4Fe4S-binding SPASM domain
VVGIALVSIAVGAAVLNAWSDRFRRYTEGDGPPGADPKVRRDGSGAKVAWKSPPAILGVDGAGAAAALAAGAQLVGTGIPIPGALSAPDEVHVAVTERCPVRCDGCYLDAGPERGHADLGALEADLRRLAAMGVFEVALGGGESPARADRVAGLARELGMTPNLTTSGFGVSDARATRMRDLYGQVNISVDGDAGYVATRGWDGRQTGWNAIDRLVAAGVRVGVNTVLSREVLSELEAFGRAIAARGVSEWQWLRYKPAGRATVDYLARRPEPADLDSLWPRLLAIEAETGLVMRIDCSLVPFLVPHLPDPGALARLGVVGCGGGHSLLARTAAGGWAPCSFAAPGEAGDPEVAWATDAVMQSWRGRAERPPEPCGSCPAAAVCRGGCRVVAGFLTGDPLAPDPECPRVRG